MLTSDQVHANKPFQRHRGAFLNTPKPFSSPSAWNEGSFYKVISRKGLMVWIPGQQNRVSDSNKLIVLAGY